VGLKQSLSRWVAALAIGGLGVFLFVTLQVPRAYSALRVKHGEIRRLEQQNADLYRDIAEKKDRIRKLRDSRSEQELEIRKRLKLQRPGETSIVIPDSPK
jgi:hypothetical protein